jgi:hypothetical protein
MIGSMAGSDFAAQFMARHARFTDYVDADPVNTQAELLRGHGLDALNAKVLASPTDEVLDLIAEHNMGAMLARRGFTDLQHEPPSMSRPIDLVGVRGGRCYRIEVKRLAASEHDELHSSVMYTLNRALESNTGSIVIEMRLGESFEAGDINGLVRHVKESLRQPHMDERYTFSPDGEAVAWYTFHPRGNRAHPRVAAVGDVDMRDVTGVDAGRVRGKVRRAYEKFKMCPDDDAVHLVVVEANNTIDLAQVAEALYGQVYVTFTRAHGYTGSGRHPGGAFSRGLHSRLGGLVVSRRAEKHRLFCGYTFILFTNPGGTLPVDDVVEALGVERVLGPSDFP